MTIQRLAAGMAVVLLLTACASTISPTPGASGSASAQPSSSAATVGPSATESPDETTYTVQVGDTLSSIARTWGTSVGQLQAWNAAAYPTLLVGANTLQVGWILVVAGDPATTPLPTTVPTVTPTSAASGCTAGNRVAAGSQQTFTTVPNAGHVMSLTLDMGGRLDPGINILNLLIANHVCATLFPTGAMAQTTEGQRILGVVKAHSELFEIGNHTMHHCDLVKGGGGSPTAAPCAGITPTADFIRKELTDSAAILTQYSGQQPVPYWRPPYGVVNQAVRDAAASVGYTKTVLWDIDTIDWKPIADGGPTAQQIATKVVSNARDGSIVLMHLGGYETHDALKVMIPALRDRGFLLTSLSDQLS
ncbi:MAG: polysaccharide deacetylase family protein [Candidatus Limnocylindria bacterium]